MQQFAIASGTVAVVVMLEASSKWPEVSSAASLLFFSTALIRCACKLLCNRTAASHAARAQVCTRHSELVLLVPLQVRRADVGADAARRRPGRPDHHAGRLQGRRAAAQQLQVSDAGHAG